MTGNKAQVLIEKFGKDIPPNMMFEFKSKLLEAEEEEFDVIYKCRVKSRVATILFAVFLGGFGVDRFYIGDYTLGASKLAANIASGIFLSFSTYAGSFWLILAALLNYLVVCGWLIVEMFLSYKKCRYKNLLKLLHVILDKNGRDLDDRILAIQAE